MRSNPLKIVRGKAITDWASIYASAKRASPGFIEVSPLAIKDMRPLSSWLLENFLCLHCRRASWAEYSVHISVNPIEPS